jgi:hypothetical protein
MSNTINKITIPISDLWAANAVNSDGTCAIIYRVVSEDGIKISAWSVPQFISIPAPLQAPVIDGGII